MVYLSQIYGETEFYFTFFFILQNRNLIDPNLLPLVLPLIEEVAAKIDDYIPHPFNEEIKGVYIN